MLPDVHNETKGGQMGGEGEGKEGLHILRSFCETKGREKERNVGITQKEQLIQKNGPTVPFFKSEKRKEKIIEKCLAHL